MIYKKRHLIFQIIAMILITIGCREVQDKNAPPQSSTVELQGNLTLTPEILLSPTTVIFASPNSEVQDLFLQENRESFQFLEIENSADYPLDVITNETNEYRAFHICNEFCGVFIEDIDKNKVFQLKSVSFINGRPFSNLKWNEDYILEFDQVTQPHQGIHYIVQTQEGELLNAFPYPIR